MRAVGISPVDINIFDKCLNRGSMNFPFKYLSVSIGRWIFGDQLSTRLRLG